MAISSQLLYNIRKQICKQAGVIAETSPCLACSYILNTGEQPFSGGENIIFALKDHDGQAICMRIQRKSSQGTSYVLKKEVEYRTSIEAFKITALQKITGYALEPTDLIPAPFITLEWVFGIVLRWTDEFPPNIEDRNRIIHAIAGKSIDLLKVQKHGISAKLYAVTRIQRKIERAERCDYPGGNVDGCRKQLNLLQDFWISDLDNAPFVLVHGDLSPNNIIIDEDFVMQSILDLGWADMVPLQFAAAYPRFLTHEPREIYSSPATAFTYYDRNTEMMQRDRLFYLECVKTRASSEGGILHGYYEALARADECRRYWWFRAINQVDIHRAMCACDWDPCET